MQEFHKTESGVRDTLMVSMPDEKLGTALSHRESNIAGPSPVGVGGCVCWGVSVGAPPLGSERRLLQEFILRVSKPDNLPGFREASRCLGRLPRRTAVQLMFLWGRGARDCDSWKVLVRWLVAGRLAGPPLQSSRRLSL